MKAFTLVAVLCLLNTSAFSIGRPHNVFATHKAVTERVANQPKKNGLPQPSILKNVTHQAQNGIEETRQVVSTVGKIVGYFLKISQ
jgi:dihydroorotate dehydrogenase